MRHFTLAEWNRLKRTKRCEREDIAGDRSGRLEAKNPVAVDIHGNVVWRCQCECGGEARVTTSNFHRKAVRSCGCITREIHARRTVASCRRRLTDAIARLESILGPRQARQVNVGAR